MKKGKLDKTKKVDQWMARKQAEHQQRQEAGEPHPEASNDKYDYLTEKNWDEMFMDEGADCMATNFMEEKGAFKLADLSKVETNIPFDPSYYDVTHLFVNVASQFVKQLLCVPTQFEFEEQRDKLKDEDKEKWVRFIVN